MTAPEHSSTAAADRGGRAPEPAAAKPPEWVSSLMMTPSDFIRHRLLALLILRLIGFAFVAASVLPIVSWLSEGLRDGDLLDMYYYGGRFVTAFVLGVMGVAGMVAAGPLSRRFVVMPREPRCPECRFSLAGLTEPRCPECGLRLDGGVPRVPTRHTAAQHRSWLLGTVVGLRLVAVGFLMFGLSGLLQWLWWAVDDASALLYPFLGTEELVVFTLAIVTALLPGALLWWLAPPIGRMCLQAGMKPEIEPVAPDDSRVA